MKAIREKRRVPGALAVNGMIVVPTGPSGGAAISISDGLIITGAGFFGAPGITAIGVGE